MKKGGLARRAGKISEIRQTYPDLLLVDGGDAFDHGKELPRERARSMMTALDLMGYDAMTPGEQDLAFGVDSLAELAGGARVSLISANLSISGHETLSMAPYVIKTMGNLRVAVTGVTPAVFFPSDVLKDKRLIAGDPSESLKRVASELKGKADIVILLSHLGLDGTKSLLASFPEPVAHLAIAGHGRHMTPEPEIVAGTPVVQTSFGGEYLGKVILFADKTGKVVRLEAEAIPLTDEIMEDEKARGIMDAFYEAVIDARVRRQEEQEKIREQEAIAEQVKKGLQMKPREFMELMKRKEEARTTP